MAFLFTGVLALAACALTATLVHEDFVKPTAEELAARPSLVRGLAVMARSRDLLAMFTVLMINRLTIGGVGPVTALFVGELGVAEASVPTVAGLSFSVAGIGAALTAPLLGRLADRVGGRRVLVVSLLGSAVFFLPQAWVVSAWQFLALRFAMGVFSGGIQPAAYAMVGRLAPPGQQSAVYGLTFSATALGNFIGPLLSGAVAAGCGLRSVFIYTGLLVGLNALWVATAVRGGEGRTTSPTGRGPARQGLAGPG